MEIFSNPIVKKLALSQFEKLLKESNKHGIYIYFEDDEVKADYYDEHPNLTILKTTLNHQNND